jgi:heme exporter protein CcmD
MNEFFDFLSMDKNAPYLWASYGIFAVFFIANIIAPSVMKRSMLKQEKRRRRREHAQ